MIQNKQVFIITFPRRFFIKTPYFNHIFHQNQTPYNNTRLIPKMYLVKLLKLSFKKSFC